MQIKKTEFSKLSLKIYALASDIGFFYQTPSGEIVEHEPSSVTILEPSHRGDMPSNSINEVVQGIFSLFKR